MCVFVFITECKHKDITANMHRKSAWSSYASVAISLQSCGWGPFRLNSLVHGSFEM